MEEEKRRVRMIVFSFLFDLRVAYERQASDDELLAVFANFHGTSRGIPKDL